MGKRVSKKHKRMAAPEWVFLWRRSKDSAWQQTMATLIVTGVFALFLTSMHIRVTTPTSWATQKASVIHVTDDAVGRALTLRAREGGPFPSRFDPGEWEGSATLEQTALEVTRWRPPPYVPVLKDLPDDFTPSPVAFAARGEATLPKPEAPRFTAPADVTPRLAPVLYPLSGVSAAALPRELPSFDGVVDAPMAAAPWRFFIRLDAVGNVIECDSLAGGDEPGLPALDAWLRRVSFAADSAQPCRWIAVGVGFTNHPTDGSDSH